MTIYSWNVNGIRAIIKKGNFTDFINNEHPDILCLQEIKAKPDQFNFDHNSYHAYWCPAEKPGYSGTGILTKIKPDSISYGLPENIATDFNLNEDSYGKPNLEGRVLTAEYSKFYVVTVYTPNAKEDLTRLKLRYEQWDPAFLKYVSELEKNKPVIFCGDLNVAHSEDDLANPGPNRGKKGFTNEEREGVKAYLDSGFIDSFRQFKKGNGYYTWWSHFANSRARNIGWRIDYIMISNKLKNKLRSANILANYFGSDHCPISIDIDI